MNEIVSVSSKNVGQTKYVENITKNTFVTGSIEEIKRKIIKIITNVKTKDIANTTLPYGSSFKLEQSLKTWNRLPEFMQSLECLKLGSQNKITVRLHSPNFSKVVIMSSNFSSLALGNEIALLVQTNIMVWEETKTFQPENSEETVVQHLQPIKTSGDKLLNFVLADLKCLVPEDKAVTSFVEFILSKNPSAPKINPIFFKQFLFQSHNDKENIFDKYILINQDNTLLVLFSERYSYSARFPADSNKSKAALCLPTGIYPLGGSQNAIIKALSNNDLKRLLNMTNISLAGTRLSKEKYNPKDPDFLSKLVVKSMTGNERGDR